MELPYRILWIILVSLAGMVLFNAGRKQREFVSMGCGAVMMIMPYFVGNSLLMLALAALLGVLAWKLHG